MRYNRTLATLLSIALIAVLTSCICQADNYSDEKGALYLKNAFPDRSEVPADKIAFALSGDLYLISATGVETVEVDGAYGVAWSPDGNSLLVAEKRPGSNSLYDFFVISGEGWSTRDYVLTNFVGGDQSATVDWSMKGNRIVYAGAKTDEYGTPVGSSGVYVTSQDGPNLRLVTRCGPSGCCFPTWSSDGTRIAYVTRYGVEVIDPDNPEDHRTVYEFSTDAPAPCYGRNVSWFEDSQRLLISDGLKIQIVDLVDGATTTLFQLDPQVAEGYVRAMVLPDGEHVVYQAWYKELNCSKGMVCFHREVMLSEVDNLAWRDVTPDVEDIYNLSLLDWWQAQ